MRDSLPFVTLGLGILIGVGLLVEPSALSAASKDVKPQPDVGLTIFMDVSLGGRKHRAAEKMTKLHQEHLAKGWKVIDVEPYIENGDLEGFFLTYVARD